MAWSIAILALMARCCRTPGRLRNAQITQMVATPGGDVIALALMPTSRG